MTGEPQVRFAQIAPREPKWELLVHSRQFSYPSAPLGTSEWQPQDLRDTQNERVRNLLKTKTGNWGHSYALCLEECKWVGREDTERV